MPTLSLSTVISRARSLVLVPLVALLCVETAIALTALACSVSPLQGSSYVHWDSVDYLTIATRGYYLEMQDGHIVGGNTAWFPGYSMVIRALKPRHVAPAKIGKLVSTLFALGLLITLWSLLSTAPVDGGSRLLTLLLGAFFPGFIYYHVVYPIAMAAGLGLLSIALCARGRHWASGLLGAASAATYTTGFLLAAALAFGIVRDRRLSLRAKLFTLLKAPLLVLLGLGAVFLYQEHTVGWDAFFRMQRDYCASEWANPLRLFIGNTEHVWRGDIQTATLPQLEIVAVSAMVVAISILCWRQRASLTLLESMLWANVCVFWVFPLLVGPVGRTSPRADAMLVGIVPLLARVPIAMQTFLLCLFVALGIGLSALFFQNLLV